MLFFKKSCCLTVYVTQSCCVSLRGNLDFLQKQFYNTDSKYAHDTALRDSQSRDVALRYISTWRNFNLPQNGYRKCHASLHNISPMLHQTLKITIFITSSCVALHRIDVVHHIKLCFISQRIALFHHGVLYVPIVSRQIPITLNLRVCNKRQVQ